MTELVASGKEDFQREMLREAIDSVLACPLCNGRLAFDGKETCLHCAHCQGVYPIHDGIPVLLDDQRPVQKEEAQWRDGLAIQYFASSRESLLDMVGEHHCVPVMRKHVAQFKQRFALHEWILDVGVGLGWHWIGHNAGVNVLGVDMSLGNLRLARRLLDGGNNRIVLVCADAAALPIRERSMAGLWSAQVFQHFPEEVLHSVLADLHRVLKEEFVLEIYNLNPALLLRMIYRLFGKRLHCRGKADQMELNRLSPQDWGGVWKQFRGGHHQVSCGYSELFFHPDLHVRPRPYPEKVEAALVKYIPTLTALFARQGQVRIDRSGVLVS